MSFHSMRLFFILLCRNGNSTQGKLRMNLRSLSESVSESLEYGRYCLLVNVISLPGVGDEHKFDLQILLHFQELLVFNQKKKLNLQRLMFRSHWFPLPPSKK